MKSAKEMFEELGYMQREEHIPYFYVDQNFSSKLILDFPKFLGQGQ